MGKWLVKEEIFKIEEYQMILIPRIWCLLWLLFFLEKGYCILSKTIEHEWDELIYPAQRGYFLA
jgi:hypothetical protein